MKKAFSVLFKIACVLAILCIVTIFFTENGSAEFWITLISVIMNVTLAIASAIIIIVKRDRE